MARFYGELRSGHGKDTRCGSINHPLSVVAATHSGAVQVDLFDREGVDWCEVYLREWDGQGAKPDKSLYHGPVSGNKGGI